MLDVEDFGDEVVMLELATGAYWSIKGRLMGVARGLKSGASVEACKMWASEAFASSDESEMQIVVAFLKNLEDRGLLQEDTEAISDWSEVLAPEGLPVFTLHEELSDLVKLDPIHDVSDAGWPHEAPKGNREK